MAKPIIRHARQIIYDNAEDIGHGQGIPPEDVVKAQDAIDVLHGAIEAHVPDAPAAYAGNAGLRPRVNGAETNLELAAISELEIVPAHDLVTFRSTVTWPLTGSEPGGSSGPATSNTVLRGLTVTDFNMIWTYNNGDADPHSQSLDHGIGALAVGLRAYNHTPVAYTTNQTYNLTAEGFEFPVVNPITGATTLLFLNARYWGVHSADLLVDANADDTIRGLVGTTFTREFCPARAVTKIFNPALGAPPNYLYFAYPSSFGLPPQTFMGGFAFTDWSSVVFNNFDNGTGYTENYYIIRTNPQYNLGPITWQLT